MVKTQRIRDPIHDLIIFDESEEIDRAAWALLLEPELQRLRRIRQLGVSEFVFPSATHTRFAHSLGVFHNARRLMKIIEREINLGRVAGQYDNDRAKVAILAALLHDIGHGPFSHAFEEARKSIEKNSNIKKHESYTAEMIENESSNIGSILNSVNIKTSEVADLLRAEVPSDMYHSVVSSSFDADRLDYFQRDRYMTGVGSGAIDLSWLMDNVRVADIDVSAVGGEDDKPIYTHSFCLGLKAKEAAEDFLLSRYRLYSNVYFHKTTRGFEKLVAAFFRIIANKVRNNVEVKGLYPDHPLLKFFQKGGDSLDNYLRIDDSVVVGAMHSIAWFGDGPEVRICEMYLTRQRPFCLDVQYSKPNDAEAQRHLKHWLNEEFSEKLDEVVFYDNIKLSLYGEIGADDSKAQKRLMILLPTGRPREITEFGDSLIKGGQQRVFDRYYFINNQDYEKAIAKAKEV